MGAVVETGPDGRPPLTIRGGSKLKALTYTLPMASAQVKSCLLLAGLYAEGKTTVTEPAPTRDHTERMLRGFGYSVETNGPVASLQSGGKLTATRIEVAGGLFPPPRSSWWRRRSPKVPSWSSSTSASTRPVPA